MTKTTGDSSNGSSTQRVRIVYHVNGEDREFPFVIGVLSDLSGDPEHPLPSLRLRRFTSVNADNFDQVIDKIRPRLVLTVPALQDKWQTDRQIVLNFKTIEDFEPDNLASQIPESRKLLETRQHLHRLLHSLDLLLEERLETACRNQTTLDAIAREISTSTAPWGGELIDRIALRSRNGRAEQASSTMKSCLRAFFDQVISGQMPLSKDINSMLEMRIMNLDREISWILNGVMHLPKFKLLEACWRGLEYLVSRTEPSSICKIKVLNVTKAELLADFRRASEFDKTRIFDRVYNDELDTFGGEPFGALLGDYYFCHDGDDIEILEGMSRVAAAAQCPFIAGASPSFFNFMSFEELAGPHELAPRFDSVDYARWRAFRDAEDSRYVGLVLPRILLRLPYGQAGAMAVKFEFREASEPDPADLLLWGNAAYAFGARLIEAFQLYGWCAAIRGVETGGLVSGLPTYETVTDRGDVAVVCPCEIALTDHRESELSALGFIPLCYRKGTDQAVFFHAQSCNMPRLDKNTRKTTIAVYSSQLEYILATSRFGHYLKALIRDKIDRFKSAGECEAYVNNWISTYVQKAADPNNQQEQSNQRAQEEPAKPLVYGRIEINSIPGYADAYQATALLLPHFQLHQLTVPLRLIMKLQLGGTLIYRIRTPVD